MTNRPPDGFQNQTFLNTGEPPLKVVLGDRLVLLQLIRDGLTPRHLLALERAAHGN